MTAPVTAVVTGFTKIPEMLELSFVALRTLKAEGVIQRILYVTWDTPSVDPYVAPAAGMKDIELVRVPQPKLTGTNALTGVMYQIHNLEAALALIPEDNALIFKTRPDFLIDENFLRTKITQFDRLCAPSDLPRRLGIYDPPPVFSSKIWLPWADSNQPFNVEDAAFMGRKRDVVKLADRGAARYLKWGYCDDLVYGTFCHIVRLGVVFEHAYPIFHNYLRNFFPYFPNTEEYRETMLPIILQLPFYWYLIVVNAWILATNFHVDCGLPGQMLFYPNSVITGPGVPSLKNLETHPPFNFVDGWRAGEQPGGVFPCVARLYGRLVDDSWQNALFTQPLRDFDSNNLLAILRNMSTYPNSLLEEIEDDFYGTLADLYHSKWLTRCAA